MGAAAEAMSLQTTRRFDTTVHPVTEEYPHKLMGVRQTQKPLQPKSREDHKKLGDAQMAAAKAPQPLPPGTLTKKPEDKFGKDYIHHQVPLKGPKQPHKPNTRMTREEHLKLGNSFI